MEANHLSAARLAPRVPGPGLRPGRHRGRDLPRRLGLRGRWQRQLLEQRSCGRFPSCLHTAAAQTATSNLLNVLHVRLGAHPFARPFCPTPTATLAAQDESRMPRRGWRRPVEAIYSAADTTRTWGLCQLGVVGRADPCVVTSYRLPVVFADRPEGHLFPVLVLSGSTPLESQQRTQLQILAKLYTNGQRPCTPEHACHCQSTFRSLRFDSKVRVDAEQRHLAIRAAGRKPRSLIVPRSSDTLYQHPHAISGLRASWTLRTFADVPFPTISTGDRAKLQEAPAEPQHLEASKASWRVVFFAEP